MTATLEQDVEDAPVSNNTTRRVLLVVIAVAVAVVVATGAWWLGSRDAATSDPSSSSVDAGFARDMSTHHQQAVVMARYERLYTHDSSLRLIAYDIEDTQVFQMGEMQGWLDSWGLSRADAGEPMSWMSSSASMDMHMGANGLMPGMATPTQMNELTAARGTALDKLFLQLMIHHHQGGVAMAQDAAAHASEPYVRALASSMVAAQSDEIIQMEQKLRQLGGSPLPKP